MVEQIDPSAFFGNDASAPEKGSAAGSSTPNQIEASDFFANKPVASQPEISEEEKKYRAKVEKYMPEATKYYKNTDPTIAAAKEGLQRSFIIGPVLNELGADIEAALPTSLTGLEGESYGERRQDFKARSEALTRAGTAKSPITANAAELAGSFAVPMGGIAGATEEAVAGAAPSLGKFIPKSIGMATEAGTYAGLGAAAEKAFGTQPESEKPDILSTAGIGAEIGAALPGIGKVAGVAAEKFLPDWAQEKLAGSNYQLQQFMKNVAADEAAGEKVLGLNGALEAIKNNPDAQINAFDVGGTRTQNWLLKSFKGRGDALDNFQNTLAQRLDGATDRFGNALLEAAGAKGDLNLDDLAKQSEQYAKDQNNLAYTAAHAPDNGRGVWSKKWESQFSDPRAVEAAQQVNSDMAGIYGRKFVAPINRVGNQSIDTLKLSPATSDFLKLNKINTLDDLAAQNQNKFADIFARQSPSAFNDEGMLARRALSATGMPESAINTLSDKAAVDLAKMNELSLVPSKVPLPGQAQAIVNEVGAALKNKNLNKLTLTNPNSMNVEWLDKYQQRLKDQRQALAKENLPRNMPFVGRLQKFQDQIVGGLKGSVNNDGTANKFYDPKTYNAAFDKAHTQAAQFHRQNSAFEAGAKFFRNLNDGVDASSLANDVKNMNAQEHKMFAQGMLGQIKYLGTQNGVLNYNKLNKWFNNPYLKDIMETTLGQHKLEKLQSVLKAESIMQQSLQRAAQLERRSGNLNDWKVVNKDLIALGMGHLFDPYTFGLAGVAYNHASSRLGNTYAQKLRKMLESGDLKQMQRAYDQMMANPNTRTPFLDSVAHIVAKNLPQMRTRAEGGSVLDDSPPIEMPHSLQELQNWNKNHAKSQSMDDVFTGRVSGFEGASPLAMPASLAELQSYKRTKRATGGRIPDVDKLFKEAKKTLDGQTKPMLNVHDDAIVHALRIAQGRV